MKDIAFEEVKSYGADGASKNDVTNTYFSLEMIRLTYLPTIYTCGVGRRVPLSVQHIHVGSRFDNVLLDGVLDERRSR